MTQEEKLQFKFKYDKMLDDVFFTSKFKQYIVEKCKYCPDGLTIDTNIIHDEIKFVVCTKKYGYEFSGERVPGDFYDLKYQVEEKMTDALLDYLAENNAELYNEIFKYAVYC